MKNRRIIVLNLPQNVFREPQGLGLPNSKTESANPETRAVQYA